MRGSGRGRRGVKGRRPTFVVVLVDYSLPKDKYAVFHNCGLFVGCAPAADASGAVQGPKLGHQDISHSMSTTNTQGDPSNHHAPVSAALPVISLTWPPSAEFKIPVR